MPDPSVKPLVRSIYEVAGERVLMPERMAKVSPADLKRALYGIRDELQVVGGKLELSDLFRSYACSCRLTSTSSVRKRRPSARRQAAACTEAGRAFDVDLSRIKVSLADFLQTA